MSRSTLQKMREYGLRRSVVVALKKVRRHLDPADRFLRKCHGVVHVGANSGQERFIYARHNLPVLWIEPLPDVYEALCRNIAAFPQQRALNALITDKDGAEYPFYVADNDGASSSIYPWGDGRTIWPDLTFPTERRLRSTTLDAALQDSFNSYDALVMDTQGSELLVLKGATHTLQCLKFIKTEAANFEMYRGAVRDSEMIAFLQQRGFRLIRRDMFAESANGDQCVDLLFRRH